MKQQFYNTLDFFIPAALKDAIYNAEQDRARGSVFVLLSYLSLAIPAFIVAALLIDLSSLSNEVLLVSLGASVCVYTIALIAFYKTGNLWLAGNLFGLSFYQSTLIAAFTQPEQYFAFTMLHILSLPLLISHIANYASGIVWLFIINLTPLVIISADLREMPLIYLPSWLITSATLFLAMTLSHYYRESMVWRLRYECLQFEFAASHDGLTGLVNRITFDRRLQESIDHCRNFNRKAAFAYIDLDKFKLINDTLGHQAGDQVLITIANRLRELVRHSDTVARLGGDEFAILFDHYNFDDVGPLLQRLSSVVNEPIPIDHHDPVRITCSVGVVVCPDDGIEADQLANAADKRMYQQKRLCDADNLILKKPTPTAD